MASSREQPRVTFQRETRRIRDASDKRTPCTRCALATLAPSLPPSPRVVDDAPATRCVAVARVARLFFSERLLPLPPPGVPSRERALLSLLIPFPVPLVSWPLVLPSNLQLCLPFRSRCGRERNLAWRPADSSPPPPTLLHHRFLLRSDLDPRASCPW